MATMFATYHWNNFITNTFYIETLFISRIFSVHYRKHGQSNDVLITSFFSNILIKWEFSYYFFVKTMLGYLNINLST